jgi:serine/threonine protein kinase
MDEATTTIALLGQLRADQHERWKRGDRRPAERYFAEHHELQSNERLLVDLIYSEFCLREELGENPEPGEYLERFPQFAGELRSQFEIHEEIEADRRRLVADIDSSEKDVPALSETSHPKLTQTLVVRTGSPRADAPVAPADSLANGMGQFGDYEILAEISRGGMGVVYRAWQIPLKREVAIKVILSGRLASEHEVKRFYAEAEAAATLDHPNIVRIFQVGQHEGRHFFSMAYVDGPSLSDKLAEGAWAPHDAAGLVQQIADAVQYAHARGVVHRDLKPQNVLLTKDGQPHVTDFGLAKRLEGSSDLTSSGEILGTPSYMPPEQALGKTREIGPLSDVYSLGAILYSLLTAHPPFSAADPISILRKVIETQASSPRELNPRVDHDLETITLKCLQKDANHRYSSAGELADDLGRYLRGEPINARPVGTLEQAWRWCRRTPLVASLLALVALALVGGTVISTWFAVQANREAARAELNATQAQSNANEGYRLIQGLTESLKILANPALEKSPEFLAARSAAVSVGVEAYRGSMKLDDPAQHVEEDANTWIHIGLLETIDQKHKLAREAYEQAVRVASIRARESDDSGTWGNAGQAYLHLGMELWEQGQRGDAADSLSQARSAFEKAVRKVVPGSDGERSIYQGASWFHAFCPDPRIRDIPFGLRCAKKAMELSSRVDEETNIRGGFRPTFTLALSTYRSITAAVTETQSAERRVDTADQRLREVRDSMERVTSQSPAAALVATRDPYWWFLRSMVEARLGNQETARALYAKAEQCWKENRFADFELHFLNDEAKSLLKQ